MLAPRIRSALVILTASAGLTGCAYGQYGNQGYGGVSVGYDSGYGAYGSPYYGSGYGSPYYGAGYGYGSPYYGGGYGYGSGYGYGYQPSYYGWHNDYYYPGTGYYVYGRDGKRWQWSPSQRRYWENRRVANPTDNWDGYRRTGTQGDRVATRAVTETRVVNVTRPRTVERQVVRSNGRADRAERQQIRRAERRATSESRQSDRKRRNDD